jgi:hypothetical protein
MLMLLSALATEPAHAAKTQVGTKKKLGVGVSGGIPNSFTMKYYLKPKSGIAVHVGLSLFWGSALRVQYEQDFWNIGNWAWGKLDMDFNVGVMSWMSLSNFSLLPGAGGGVGVHLRFKDVPAEVFIDNAVYVYPTAFLNNTRGLSYVGGAGGRWYF